MAVTRENIEMLLVRLGGRREESEARAEDLRRELQELLLAAKNEETDSDRIQRVAEAFASEMQGLRLLREFTGELRSLLT